jgi:hypothetical protein
MEKSEPIIELSKALAKFQAEVKAVPKNGLNPYFKSKYATLEDVITTIKEPLSKNGLSFSQFPTGDNELSTILMHESGQYLKATCKINPKDNTPQGVGSAITYMRRYAISAILGLATDEDDDGNAASKEDPKNSLKMVAFKKAITTATPEHLNDFSKKLIGPTYSPAQKTELKKLMDARMVAFSAELAQG